MLDIFLLDNQNNTKEEINIIKPNTYQELLEQIQQKFLNISKYFEIFFIDSNNKEIKINNEINYKKIKDIIFIRELNKSILEQSLFDINYNKLSESKQEILDEKYNCILCSIIIKNENPYLCYKCQKIFHEKCLKDWDKKCKSQNKNLECPNCRNELEIEKWNKKIDHDDNRKEEANLMNKINEYEIKDKDYILKDNKINKYEIYIRKTIEIFKNIVYELNSINNLLKLEKIKKFNNIINKFPLDMNKLEIDDISEVIHEQLKKFKFYIINKNSENKNDNIININKIKENKFNEIKNDEFKNKINLIYYAKDVGTYNIFGEKFVENNKNNLDLYINYQKNYSLISKCLLKEGENIITIIPKKNLNNLSYMLHNCNSLKDITELKYLYVKDTKDFSYMFSGCTSLSDINSIKDWNVSNGENFEHMFSECSSLSNIKALKSWNVSNSKNLEGMFFECASLLDLNNLYNWNVSNCKYFTDMFRGCSLITDITALRYWNVSKGINFKSMFSGCHSLSIIYSLQNWNMTNGIDLECMFYGCSSLSDLNPLKNWDVSNCEYFSNMFYGCMSLSDLKPLQNWNVSKGKNFNNMFSKCPLISDISPLKTWKLSIIYNLKDMFPHTNLINN